MDENDKPIHQFDGLKNLLKRKGYLVEKATGYRVVENKDVDLNNLRNNIEFTPEGIFLKDSNEGSRQQIFLYKLAYHLHYRGRIDKPRFHIRKCEIIQSFINSGRFKAEYRRANTNRVMVKDMDDGNKEKYIDDLPLCKNCLKMALNAPDAHAGMTSSEFVKILEQAEDAPGVNKVVEVNNLGFTKDWNHVKLAHLESKEYRCEKCGVQISDPFDYPFMDVHHKDGNRANNKKSNLRCLCIECHSTINSEHRKQFDTRAKKLMIEEFREKYR